MKRHIIGGIIIATVFVTGASVNAMEPSNESMMKTGAAMVEKGNSMMKKDDAMMKNDVMTQQDENLWQGRQGEAVVALQTLLEAKGFLMMPTGVEKGYFGARTKLALMKYQTMLGVPATGYYGYMTRTKQKAMMSDGALMKKMQ